MTVVSPANMRGKLIRCNSKHMEDSHGVYSLEDLEGAILPSKKVIHFPFPFRFEEDIEEDRDYSQEAGHRHHSYHQPCKCGVCEER